MGENAGSESMYTSKAMGSHLLGRARQGDDELGGEGILYKNGKGVSKPGGADHESAREDERPRARKAG